MLSFFHTKRQIIHLKKVITFSNKTSNNSFCKKLSFFQTIRQIIHFTKNYHFFKQNVNFKDNIIFVLNKTLDY